jgi:hypothetical protein
VETQLAAGLGSPISPPSGGKAVGPPPAQITPVREIAQSREEARNIPGDSNTVSAHSSTEDETRRDRQGSMLASISRMTGLDNERLVHEICINPMFRLPPNEVDPRSVSVSWRMSRTAGPALFKVVSKGISPSQAVAASPAGISLGAIESFETMPEGSPRAGRTLASERPLSPSAEGWRHYY